MSVEGAGYGRILPKSNVDGNVFVESLEDRAKVILAVYRRTEVPPGPTQQIIKDIKEIQVS